MCQTESQIYSDNFLQKKWIFLIKAGVFWNQFFFNHIFRGARAVNLAHFFIKDVFAFSWSFLRQFVSFWIGVASNSQNKHWSLQGRNFLASEGKKNELNFSLEETSKNNGGKFFLSISVDWMLNSVYIPISLWSKTIRLIKILVNILILFRIKGEKSLQIRREFRKLSNRNCSFLEKFQSLIENNFWSRKRKEWK